MRLRSCARPYSSRYRRENPSARRDIELGFIGVNHFSLRGERSPVVFVPGELIPSRMISRGSFGPARRGGDGSTLCCSGSCGERKRERERGTSPRALENRPLFSRLFLDSPPLDFFFLISPSEFYELDGLLSTSGIGWYRCGRGDRRARKRIADLFNHNRDDGDGGSAAKDEEHLARAGGIIFISRKTARRTASARDNFRLRSTRETAERARLFANDKCKTHAFACVSV